MSRNFGTRRAPDAEYGPEPQDILSDSGGRQKRTRASTALEITIYVIGGTALLGLALAGYLYTADQTYQW